MRVEDIAGTRVLFIDTDARPISTNEDTLNLVSSAWAAHVDLVVVPAHRLDPRFFQLESLFAGDVVQKTVNYNLQLAVLGDIDPYLAKSEALRDFVWESNRGNHVWFVTDEAALQKKLTPQHPATGLKTGD
jgi:hypothetical protein